MATIFKGGRHQKAPYETTVIRVPVPLKEMIESLINKYKENDCQASSLETVPVSQAVITKEAAITLANQLIKSKKGGAKYCLEKLLQVMFGSDVSLG